MGDSSAVEAQKLANEANKQIAEQTNQANRDIAHEGNEYNYRMFNEQNQWNLDQWTRENEYNSPEKQVERYVKAGINPLWAIGNGNPGNAQQLTSAQAAPAITPEMHGAHVEPEYDTQMPAKVQGIIGALNTVVNGAQGFAKLGLEAQDVETRRAAQQSQASLNKTEAYYKRSLTSGQDIRNAFDTATFDTRIQSSIKQLDLLEADYNKTVQEGKNAVELGENLKASRDLIRKEIENKQSEMDARIMDIRIKQRLASVAERGAAVQERNAQVNEDQLALNQRQFNLDVSRYNNEVSKMSNDELFRWASTFATRNRAKGSLSGGFDVGVGELKAGAEYEGSDVSPNLAAYKAAQTEAYKRFSENPTIANANLYKKVNELVDDFPSDAPSSTPSPLAPRDNSSVDFDIMNPFTPWAQ